MIKVAMLSKWHVHASGYAQSIKNTKKPKSQLYVMIMQSAYSGAAAEL